MSNITTSTTIRREIYDRIKKEGWKVSELVRLGVCAKEQNPQLIQRIKELEAENSKISAKLQTYAKRLFELESGETIK